MDEQHKYALVLFRTIPILSWADVLKQEYLTSRENVLVTGNNRRKLEEFKSYLVRSSPQERIQTQTQRSRIQFLWKMYSSKTPTKPL